MQIFACWRKGRKDSFSERIGEGSTWWRQWFKEIRPWKESDVDRERVMWIRVHGVPCHVWGADFFVMLANSIGSFICIDENTANIACLDIARVMVRVPFSFNLLDGYLVEIYSKDFWLILREDTWGPLCISPMEAIKKRIQSEDSRSDSSRAYPDEDYGEKALLKGHNAETEGYSSMDSSE